MLFFDDNGTYRCRQFETFNQLILMNKNQFSLWRRVKATDWCESKNTQWTGGSEVINA
jgi:hypothetical protein